MRHRLKSTIFYCGLIVLTLAIGVIATEQQGNATTICSTSCTLSTQSQFHDLTEEAGLAFSYLPAAPAAPLGFPHFEVGAEVSASAIHTKVWDPVFKPNSAPSYLPVPKIRARVGLPFGIDVGASYGYVPELSIETIGGEIKWAAYKGGVIMPAIAIRGTYATLLGVSDVGLQTYGADLSISKGFAIFTPYAGIGQVWMKGKATGSLAGTFSAENINKTRGFAGLQIGIPLISFVAEAAFSTINTYTARLSVGF